VRVRVSVEGDGRVIGEVENEGEGRIEPRPVDVPTGRGLGLRIVDALVRHWRVINDRPTRIRFELRSPSEA
jgi:hypothetical protein